METSFTEPTFQTKDDKRRRKLRILYKQKRYLILSLSTFTSWALEGVHRRRDKESLQQRQARLAKQRKYYRQRRAKMTQEQHTTVTAYS